MKNVKTIGIVLETVEDAKALGLDLDLLVHWREDDEVAQIRTAIEDLGFDTLILGTPKQFCENYAILKGKVDFIFNLSVGFITRFRQAMGPMFYELINIPYSGADPYTKLVGQNKHLMKSFLDKLKIPTPAWEYIDHIEQMDSTNFPDFPLIVKPSCEGTSVGINSDSVVYNITDLRLRVRYILEEIKMSALVESFVVGKEMKYCAIGNQELLFQGLIEDVMADGSSLEDKFLFMHAKKESSFSKRHVDISAAQFASLVSNCNRLYRSFTPLDYGVIDIRMNRASELFIIEFNADASLHPDRTLAQTCKLNGVSYAQMIQMILQSSFDRYGIKKA